MRIILFGDGSSATVLTKLNTPYDNVHEIGVREFYFDNKKVKITRKIKPPKPRPGCIASLTACEYVLKYDFSTKTIHRAETVHIWKMMKNSICYSSLLYVNPRFEIFTSPQNDPLQYYDLVYENPTF
jgi:hypothetical protein